MPDAYSDAELLQFLESGNMGKYSVIYLGIVPPLRSGRYGQFQTEYLPARASEQGNVFGSVRIYMCVQKKIVIERTRDLIYLKFVARDIFLKIISLSAGENSGDLA